MNVRLRYLSSAQLGAAIALLGFFFLLLTGVDAVQAIRLTFIVGLQVFAGAYCWSHLRSNLAQPVELIGVGLMLGPIFSTLAALGIQVAGLGGWGWLIPPAAAVSAWLLGRFFNKSNATYPSTTHLHEQINRATGWALIATAVLGLISLVPNILSYPLNWVGFAGKYHPDMLFFESMSTSLARLGPLESIFTPGSELRYHWFVYAWSGQLASAGSAAPFVVLTRVLPFLAIATASLLAISWVTRLTKVSWAPSLAVILLIMGGYVGATYGAIFNFDSPSQSLTAAWLLGFGLVVILLLGRDITGKPKIIGTLFVIAAIAFALAGGKISTGVEAVAAVALLTLVGLARRSWWRRRALAGAVATFIGFSLGYILLVSGSADPGQLRLGSLLYRASSVQGINPIPGEFGIVLGTLILLIAMSCRWAGLLWFIASPQRRWDPVTLLGSGFAVTGLTAAIALSSGLNETWFALAASAPLAAISAAGVAQACDTAGLNTRKNLKVIRFILGTAAALSVLVAILWMTGASGGNLWVGTLRWLGPLVGIAGAGFAAFLISRTWKSQTTVAKTFLTVFITMLVLLSAPSRLLGVGTGQVGMQPGLSNEAFGTLEQSIVPFDSRPTGQWSDQHVAIADWLKTHAQINDIIATNITAGAFVTALTQMPTYSSAVSYQGLYGPPSEVQPLLEREKASWAFIDSPSVNTLAPLCLAGVKYLWVDPLRTKQKSWLPFAEIVKKNSAATILRLPPQSCAN